VSGGSKHHLSVCTIFKAQASDPQLGVQRFLEWLAYHETVGVQVHTQQNVLEIYIYHIDRSTQAEWDNRDSRRDKEKGRTAEQGPSDWSLCDGGAVVCSTSISTTTRVTTTKSRHSGKSSTAAHAPT
jgi:hypothetical protein